MSIATKVGPLDSILSLRGSPGGQQQAQRQRARQRLTQCAPAIARRLSGKPRPFMLFYHCYYLMEQI
jgi:hypothetical protein